MAQTTGIESTTLYTRVYVEADSTMEAVEHATAETGGEALWTECDGSEFCVVIQKD